MTKNVVYKKPKWLRRISSALIDLIATLILALLLSFATTPLSNYLFDATNAQNTINTYLVETQLYHESNGEAIINTNVKDYDQRLTYFYETYTDNPKEYEDKKELSKLFVLDETTNKYVEVSYDYNSDTETRNKYLVFYREVTDHCINNYLEDFLNTKADYKNALAAISQATYFSILIAAVIAFIVFYLIVPLIDKQGRTLGKIAFKLRIISLASINAKPSKLQILFRQLITILFEYILTISTIGMFGIPLPIALIVTIILVIFTKYNQSLHDLCASTFLVDDYPNNQPINEGEKYVITYVNVEE